MSGAEEVLPDATLRAIAFRSDDGREVTFGVLYDALAQLAATSWNALERQTVLTRLADAIGVTLNMTMDEDRPAPRPSTRNPMVGDHGWRKRRG